MFTPFDIYTFSYLKCSIKQLKENLLILFGVVSLVVKHKNYESFSLKSLVRIRYYPFYFIIINSNKMGVSNEKRCKTPTLYIGLWQNRKPE